MEQVTLYRCPITLLRGEWHGCYAVENALQEQGIEYETHKVSIRRGKRAAVIEASGQALAPTIVFADGSAYRDDGKKMAAEIRAGRLLEHKGSVAEA